MSKAMKNITVKEFDEKFESGEDVIGYCDTRSEPLEEIIRKPAGFYCPIR